MSERVKSFDFVRAVCALGIVANHFAAYSSSDVLKRYLYTFPNGHGSFGYTIVTVFFIISGGLLYLNHKRIDSLQRFYSRRWMAIFPQYYLGSILALIVASVLIKGYLVDKHLYQLIFNVIGFDGYLANYYNTWILVGGWFIGAIILCYIAYPLLLRIQSHDETICTISMLVLYIATYHYDMFNQHPFRNVFSCLLSFYMGMLIFKHNIYDKKFVTMASAILLIVLYVAPIPVSENLSAHLCGGALFFVLNTIGRLVMEQPWWCKATTLVAGFSYEVFLIHSLVIQAVLMVLPARGIWTLAAFSAVMIVTLICSYGLHVATKLLLKCCGGLVSGHAGKINA